MQTKQKQTETVETVEAVETEAETVETVEGPSAEAVEAVWEKHEGRITASAEGMAKAESGLTAARRKFGRVSRLAVQALASIGTPLDDIQARIVTAAAKGLGRPVVWDTIQGYQTASVVWDTIQAEEKAGTVKVGTADSFGIEGLVVLGRMPEEADEEKGRPARASFAESLVETGQTTDRAVREAVREAKGKKKSKSAAPTSAAIVSALHGEAETTMEAFQEALAEAGGEWTVGLQEALASVGLLAARVPRGGKVVPPGQRQAIETLLYFGPQAEEEETETEEA